MTDIIVIGGANLDIKAKSLAVNHFGTSNPSRISTSPGGVARNIAHNLARLGASVGLITVIGDDHQGEAVLEATKAAGVECFPHSQHGCCNPESGGSVSANTQKIKQP